MKPTERGEAGAQQEEHRAPGDAGAPAAFGDRQDQEEQEDDDGEDGERPELPRQVGRRALLDRLRDVAHLHRALVGGQHGPDQVGGEAEGGQGDDEDDGDECRVPAGQRTVGHVFLQASAAATERRCPGSAEVPS